MRVSIIAALTADGLIARDNYHLATTWTSREDKRHFVRLSKAARHLVMGANQFSTINRGLRDRHIYVYTHKHIDMEGVETVTEEPAKLVERLRNEGVTQLMVCGGAAIYDMFMQAGLVDDLYITIEPTMFGTGLALLKSYIDVSLELDAVEQEGNSAFLHYIVKK